MKHQDEAFLRSRGDRMQRAMIAKGWTRKVLAAEAKCDEKTLRNVFAGEPVRDQTVIMIANALGLTAELEPARGTTEASDELYGGYARSVHKAYEGHYTVYRRTFSAVGGIYRSLLLIEWDEQDRRFLFLENFKDSALTSGVRKHAGSVYLSAHTNLVHLVTAIEGSVRMMTLTRLNILDGTMRGCILTQREGPMFFQPTISPIFLKKVASSEQLLEQPQTVDPDTDEWRQAASQLAFAEEHVVTVRFG